MDFDSAWTFAKQIDEIHHANSTFPLEKFTEGLEELENYKVRLSMTPTPEEISAKLAETQSYRDRVVEKMIVANNVLGIAKRAYDQCYDSELPNRIEKNSHAREASVRIKYREQLTLYLRAQEYSDSCKLILDNLKATNEVLSRQVTVLQLQLQLGELKRREKEPEREGGWLID